MIIGFNAIDEGKISFNDAVINDIPPYRRNIGMVFQNYAIFPHMTVFDNVAYGLKARKFRSHEIEDRVMKVLRLIRIEEYRDRQPSQLSGGQQQRVALARAIVIEPGILLMDEPLSNLDAKLRVEMRAVIKDIQKSLNITTVYVTHDQEEALAISDRIAVMNHGRVQQIGKPFDIYTRPKNAFVAGFIGVMNFLDGEGIGAENGVLTVSVLGKAEIRVQVRNPRLGSLLVAVRPEEAFLSTWTEEGLGGIVSEVTFLGDNMNYRISLDSGGTMEINEYIKDAPRLRTQGERVGIQLNAGKINLFSPDGSEALI